MVNLEGKAWPSLQERPTLLVPLGSTEQHGPHLPVGTDTVIAVAVAEALGAALEGAVVSPPLCFTSSGEHQGLPGVISIGNDALRLVIVELVRSAALWCGRVVLVNGHGGNIPVLLEVVDELRDEGHDVQWIPCAVRDADAHAGRTETSLMLHLAPEKVDLTMAAAGTTTPVEQLLPRLRSEGVAAVSANGILGDPAGASAAEGAEILERMVRGARNRLDRVLA